MESVEKIQKPIFNILEGSVIGVIGAEGIDKSPFILYPLSLYEIREGSATITQDETLVVNVSLKQCRDTMNDKDIVWEEVSNGEKRFHFDDDFFIEIPDRAYVGHFNVKGEKKGEGELSDGECGRLHLAKLLQCKSREALLVGEPIRELDEESLQELESIINSSTEGCAVVVSHDNKFLDYVTTHILDYSDKDKVIFYEGNLSDYEAWKKKAFDEATPSKI